MKQVFPQVRPRRLGTRGNSRYCYAGLKKRLKLEEPDTIESTDDKNNIKVKSDYEEETNSAASFLIREWVEKLLGVKFNSLRDLAVYLIDKMYVDNRSTAAFTVISAMEKSGEVQDSKSQLFNGSEAAVEMQEHKRKIEISANHDISLVKRGNLKRSKLATTQSMNDNNFMGSGIGEDTSIQKDGNATHIQNAAQGDFKTNLENRDEIPSGFETAYNDMSSRFVTTPQQQHQPSTTNSDGLIKTNQTESWNVNHTQATQAASHPPPNTEENMQIEGLDEELGNYFRERSAVTLENDENQTLKLSQLRQLLEKNLQPTISPTVASSNSAFKPAIKPEPTVGSWSPFNVSNSNTGQPASSGISGLPPNDQNNVPTSTNGNSLSSRRRVSFNPLIVQDTGQILEESHPPIIPTCTVGNGENIVTNTSVGHSNSNGSGGVGSSGSGGGTNFSAGGNGNGNLQPGQSPGATRKRHFSFQPISPRQASLPQSPSASPFISPRSTPVPSIRSRHSSGSALPLHLLPQGSATVGVSGVVIGPGGAVVSVGQKIPNFNSSSSDISRAATFGSASESSTPFISPHGTPIPFNRSRHNSAQGRLCRSRHSSGLAPYRYNIQTFSPMALSNLNNPYSPQPATPVGTVVEEMFGAQAYSNNMQTGDNMGNGNGMVVTNMTGAMSNQGDPCIIVQNDNRSRHSSANSCDMNNIHSAPMSPHCGMTPGIKDVMIDTGPPSQVYDINQAPEVKRHRHASAGNATDRQSYSRPSDWMGAPPPLVPQPVTLLRQDQPSQVQQINVQTDLRSQSVSTNQLVDSNPNTLQIGDDVNVTNNDHNLSSYPMSGGVNPSFGTSEIDFMNTEGVATSPQSGMATGNVTPDDTRSGSGDNGGSSANGSTRRAHVSGEEHLDDLDATLNELKDCDNEFSKFVQESENVGIE